MTSCVWKTSSKLRVSFFALSFLHGSSDEEDEDEDPQSNNGDKGENGQDEGSSAKRGKKNNHANPVVKTEEGVEPVKKARQPKTPSNELHIYSAAELSRLNQRELLADVQLLDGVLSFRNA